MDAKIYTGHPDGGCVDIGEIKLVGYQFISDVQIENLNECRKELITVLEQRNSLLKFAQSVKEFADKYPHDSGIYDHVKYELSILDLEI